MRTRQALPAERPQLDRDARSESQLDSDNEIIREYGTKRRRKQRARLGRRFASLVVILLVWAWIGTTVSALLFATPLDTAEAFWEQIRSGEVPRQFLVSLPALAIGYTLAVGIGVPLGLIMGRYRTVEYLTDHYMTILLATPMITVIPLAIIIFGLGISSRVAVIFMFVIPVIVVNTFRGAKAAESELVEMGRSFLLKERELFRFVILRRAAPLIFAGLRIGFGFAVTGMLLGEMIMLNVGVGGMLLDLTHRYKTAEVFGLVLALLAAAISVQAVIQWLDRRVNHWTQADETS